MNIRSDTLAFVQLHNDKKWSNVDLARSSVMNNGRLKLQRFSILLVYNVLSIWLEGLIVDPDKSNPPPPEHEKSQYLNYCHRLHPVFALLL